MSDRLRYAVNLPNLGEYADPRTIAQLAREVEDAGWDGFFVWDTLGFPDPEVPVTDPWIAIAAAAAATSRVRVGVMITALSRRRPWKVAKETVALDLLSGGRFHFGVGLGHEIERDFAAFGDASEPRDRADLLDEGLEILTGLWTGEPFSFEGERYTVNAQFRPTALQQPRIPIWVAGTWPNKRPFRRAARFDGVFPTRVGVGHLEMMPPHELEAIVQYVAEHRETDAPFDVIYEGQTLFDDPSADREKVALYRAAGLTWWVEKLGWFRGSIDDVKARIALGPPTI